MFDKIQIILMMKTTISTISVFLFNIRNYSPKVINIQRREAELNIILLRMNNLDIKQKMAWNICFIIHPKHQTKKWAKVSKAHDIPVTT